MAQFAIHGNWRSISALASLVVLLGMMAFALAGGLSLDAFNDDQTWQAGELVVFGWGLGMYVLTIVVMTLGFWSQEDSIAIAGIGILNFLIIADIILRIGVLSANIH